MSDTTEREPLGVQAEDLLATLVRANVDSLAWTTDRLMDSKDQEIQEWARAFLGLYLLVDSVDLLPRHVLHKIDLLAWKAEAAERIVNKEAT